MKRNLLKAIGIAFLIFVVLTWIVPAGSYSSGSYAKDAINATGIFDIVKIPLTTLIQFASYGVIFIVIGGLYAVMERTDAYGEFVNKVVKKFGGKEKLFLILTTIHFAVLASVTGLVIPLFILVPLYGAILVKMNFSKIVMLMSTVGAILVGCIGTTIGVNTGFNYYSGIYLSQLFSIDITSNIIAKIIIFVVITALLIFVILKTIKRENVKVVKAETKPAKKEIKEEIKPVKKTTKTPAKTVKKAPAKKTSTRKTTTKAAAVTKSVKKISTNKTNIVPLVIILSFVMILSFISMYNWSSVFGTDVFTKFHETVMGVSIGSFPILEHLFSGTSALGQWTNYDLAVLLTMASALIAWVYKFSLNEYVETFISGVKKWVPTAIYAMLASVILCAMYQMLYYGEGTLFETIANGILGITKDFNVITAALASLLGSFFYNDIYYFISSIYVPLQAMGSDSYAVLALVIQTMFGIGMLLLPTSVILIAGLSYFDVSYKSWIKNIWKFALLVLLIALIACLILQAL